MVITIIMMRTLATVILRHDRIGGSHCDWLIEHPDHPPGAGRLLAFRIPLPFLLPGAACGLAVSEFQQKRLLTRLPDHRRHYLTYQGAISGGRGRVRRIASGSALLLHYSVDRIDLELTLRSLPRPLRPLRIALRRIAINTWSAALVPVS